MITIGIDPGKTGGVAFLTPLHSVPIVHKMPATVHELVTLLVENWEENDMRGRCFVEDVHSMPSQGVTSVFTFGRGLGNIEGVLAALQIPIEWVTPQRWQKAMGCMSKGDKNVTKRRAHELWPTEVKALTHATSDAALICAYGARQP